jgi:hypothetical protein
VLSVAFNATWDRHLSIWNQAAIEQCELLVPEVESALNPLRKYVFIAPVLIIQGSSAQEALSLCKALIALRQVCELAQKLVVWLDVHIGMLQLDEAAGPSCRRSGSCWLLFKYWRRDRICLCWSRPAVAGIALIGGSLIMPALRDGKRPAEVPIEEAVAVGGSLADVRRARRRQRARLADCVTPIGCRSMSPRNTTVLLIDCAAIKDLPAKEGSAMKKEARLLKGEVPERADVERRTLQPSVEHRAR